MHREVNPQKITLPVDIGIVNWKTHYLIYIPRSSPGDFGSMWLYPQSAVEVVTN